MRDEKLRGSASAEKEGAVARALGRCTGAMIFSAFGGVWLLMSLYALGLFKPLLVALVVLAVLTLIVVAVRLRRGKDAGADFLSEQLRKSADRIYNIVNAAQGIAIFLDMALVTRTIYAQFAVSIMAMIVGLHFFVLPTPYRHRANIVTGTLMTLWTVASLCLFRGDVLLGWTALGCGMILCASAAYALREAFRLLQATAL